MEVRCEAVGVAVHRINSPLRLPNPVDEHNKKYQQAMTELSALRTRLPKFQLCAVLPNKEASSESYEVCLRPPTLLNCAGKVAEQRQEHPKLADPARFTARFAASIIAIEDRQRYDAELENYFQKYEKYIQSENEQLSSLAKMIFFDVWLENVGGGPAEHIEIKIAFPEPIQFVVEAKKIVLVSPPKLPAPPRSVLDRLRGDYMLGNIIAASSRAMEQGPQLIDPFQSCHCDGTTIRASLKRLIQNSEPHFIGSFAASFAIWEKIRPFKAKYTITSAELPQAMPGEILFKVSKDGS